MVVRNLRDTGQGKYISDYQIGTRVLSFAHQQPGVVVDVDTYAGWFDVKWDRWPYKPARRYHVGEYKEWCWKNWPIIVEQTTEPSNYTNRIVFVDNTNAKNALKAAFLTSAVINSDGGVEIDLDSLFTALTDSGWTYSED